MLPFLKISKHGSHSMQFTEIIGQQQVKHQLVEMVQNNRLSHALLFLGKEGSGSLQLAIALAQYLTCEKVSNRLSMAIRRPVLGGQSAPSLFGEETITGRNLVE